MNTDAFVIFHLESYRTLYMKLLNLKIMSFVKVETSCDVKSTNIITILAKRNNDF